MGVLNVTPDSFSDGGLAFSADGSPDLAVGIGLAMCAAGADCIDVGGESTRPGSQPTSVDEQLNRVLPVVAGLVAEGVVVSIDARRTVVARAALAAGASIVNDVGGLRPDAGMLDAVAETGAGYVIMHLRGEPRTMQDAPQFDDVVGEVAEELVTARTTAIAAGVAPEAIALDPGVGFGKTLEHNLALLAGVRRLAGLGAPLLVGTSRKSFIGTITGVAAPAERLAGSLASVVLAARDGARIVRVHDVTATVEALAVQAAIDGFHAAGAGRAQSDEGGQR
jgi:dihydropteroate synthase